MSELQRDVIMAEKMDISIERVKKLNDPLLVIGLGGTGSDIVYTIKKLFAERYELPATGMATSSLCPAAQTIWSLIPT